MVFFLYSNKAVEYQAISCIRSLENKITDDIKIVYYTIGFNSDFECKNLVKISVGYEDYPTFHFYKIKYSLAVMELFPDEKTFIFSDTDILYSRRFNFSTLKNNYNYPLAPIGPFDYPYTYEYINNKYMHYDETKIMKYFNVTTRSCNYCMTCFYVFNRGCQDFLEEWQSMVDNKYIMKNRKENYPFYDETPFNMCMWKREATETLGRCFLNTHQVNIVKQVETNNDIKNKYGNNIDEHKHNWEYIENSSNIILYHGFKQKEHIDETLNFLLQND